MTLAERLGNFAAHVSTGNPKAVRLIYYGRIAEQNTNLMRNAGVAGVLNRSLSRKANLVNAHAARRRARLGRRGAAREARDAHRHDPPGTGDRFGLHGGGRRGDSRQAAPVAVDGIYIEAPLAGYLTFLKNDDVPGVIGHVGNVLGPESHQHRELFAGP